MEEGGFEARRRPGFEAMHKMRALLRSWAGGGGGCRRHCAMARLRWIARWRC